MKVSTNDSLGSSKLLRSAREPATFQSFLDKRSSASEVAAALLRPSLAGSNAPGKLFSTPCCWIATFFFLKDGDFARKDSRWAIRRTSIMPYRSLRRKAMRISECSVPIHTIGSRATVHMREGGWRTHRQGQVALDKQLRPQQRPVHRGVVDHAVYHLRKQHASYIHTI